MGGLGSQKKQQEPWQDEVEQCAQGRITHHIHELSLTCKRNDERPKAYQSRGFTT